MMGEKEAKSPKRKTLEGACREHGLSVTPQRSLIYRIFTASDRHPSATAIYQEVKTVFPNISFDTVNRTLNTFQEIGLAKVVANSGEPKRFDPNLETHHHFHCLSCGKILDFHHSDYDALAVPKTIQERYSVVKTRVHLEGYCDQCTEK